MTGTVLLSLGAGAILAVLLIHLLNRGRARRMPMGSVRFVPASALRERRLGGVREPLLLLIRTGLIVAVVAWCRFLLLGEGAATTMEAAPGMARSTLVAPPAEPDGDRMLMQSPVFASVAARGAPASLVLADSAREGTVVAPPTWPGTWTRAPAAEDPVLTVAVVAAAERTEDERHVRAAIASLPDDRGIVLARPCEAADCPAPDLLIRLGDTSGVAATAELLDGDPTGPAGLARLGTTQWHWRGRFHPDFDDRVGTAGFPELLAGAIERAARTGVPSVAPSPRSEPHAPRWLLVLILALWFAERLLATGGFRGRPA